MSTDPPSIQMPHELFSHSSLPEKIQPSQQRQPTDPSFSSPIMDSEVHARSTPSHKLRLEADGEPLVELLWQDGAIVAQPTDRRSLGGDPGASGVTGEEEAAAWLMPDGGGGGDLYSQLWHSIAADADGGAGAFMAGSGEAGSSFCGSNAVTAPALRADDDDAAPPPPAPLEEDEPGASSAGGHPLSKRTRDELYSRREDADCEAVDESRPSRQPAGKRRTRAAEVHNQSERRRRDRINEKMKALQELVPHCNKTDKASILDEAIEYLKSLQLQVQIMWMTTGLAPMMFPGAHQLMPMPMGLNSVCMPTAQGLSQLQIVPPCMNNPLPNQMPQVQPPATNSPSVANQMDNNGIFEPKTPFLHPAIAAAQVPVLFPNGSQSTQPKEIHELLASTANPASGPRPPSSSDGNRT